MNITAVVSEALTALGYDDAHEVLQLEFRSRAIYRYFGVPALVYEALLAAPSKGKYFNQAIRGIFPYSATASIRAAEQGEA
jgi:predicted metallopeptidase